MVCTKCKYASRLNDFKGMKFEDTPCAKCSLAESSVGTVSFDEWHWGGAASIADPGDRVDELEEERMPGGDESLDADAARRAGDGRDPLVSVDGVRDCDDDLLPLSVLADAVRLLMSLPKDALEVVRLRYGGMPYAKIARLMGKSVDAVEKRHERVLEQNPVLGELFPRKVRKQRARQRRGKRCKKPG